MAVFRWLFLFSIFAARLAWSTRLGELSSCEVLGNRGIETFRRNVCTESNLKTDLLELTDFNQIFLAELKKTVYIDFNQRSVKQILGQTEIQASSGFRVMIIRWCYDSN